MSNALTITENDVTVPFDYGALPQEQATVARAIELGIKSRTAFTIVENGKDLLRAKETLGHGHFGRWLASCFPFDRRTAQRWMNVAEVYGDKSEVTSHLGNEVLCLLAAPSTPIEVRAEAEERALAGEAISVAEVERLKEEARRQRERAEAAERHQAELIERSAATAAELRAAYEGEAERKAEAILARRREEIDALEKRRAGEEVAIERNQCWFSTEGKQAAEQSEQLKVADQLIADLTTAMTALHGFECPPLAASIKRWSLVAQMATQLGEAARAFVAPRLGGD